MTPINDEIWRGVRVFTCACLMRTCLGSFGARQRWERKMRMNETAASCRTEMRKPAEFSGHSADCRAGRKHVKHTGSVAE